MQKNLEYKPIEIKGNGVYCFDDKYKRPMKMGYLIDDVFIKEVESKNRMRVFAGYGIQTEAVKLFEANGINKIVVVEKDTGKYLWCNSCDWVTGKSMDYGRGKQTFLAVGQLKDLTQATGANAGWATKVLIALKK